MAFLKNIIKKKGRVLDEPKVKSSTDGIKRDTDPETLWNIVSELGDGAFGKVYLTTKKEDSLQAALKKVEFDTETELEDYMVEIQILTDFKHPNILSLLEVYIFDSKLWMFLELCSGGALDSIIETLEKPLTEPQIRFVAREVLSGMKFLHENLIIHRDMKAGNVLLTHAYEIKLADFGVSARLANEKQKRDTFIGTPYWMAPEVIACEAFQKSPYNWKADVWSFGITLIELAETKPPHNDINPTRVLLKITKSDPPTLRRPRLWSPEFSAILARCLQKDPNQRPNCADLMSDEFVCHITESDRNDIKLLLCELNADIIDMEEEVDIAEIPDEEKVRDSTDLDLVRSIDLDDMDFEDAEEETVGAEQIAGLPASRLNENPESDTTVLPSRPTESDLEELSAELTDQLVDQVISSETRHPSVPSCVFEVMRDLNEAVETQSKASEDTSSVSHRLSDITNINCHDPLYKSHTRTRRFVVDGQVVTTTSKRIVRADPDQRKLRDEELYKRKAELRIFRLLNKQEMRQLRELTVKVNQMTEQMEQKLIAELTALKRNYELKMETTSKNFRALLERLEKEHENAMKQIRATCAKEEQDFKDHLKSDLDKYSRAERKAAKRELQSDSRLSVNLPSTVISQRLNLFRQKQISLLNQQMYHLTVDYGNRLTGVRKDELREKQTLRMNFEQEKWKLEQRHLRIRYQMNRSKMQDFFSVKRQKLSGLLELERTELRQTLIAERDRLNSSHAVKRKSHAKYIKTISKKKFSSMQQRIRGNSLLLNSQMKDQIREFGELIRQQLDTETTEFESKLQAQQDQLTLSIQNRVYEMEQNQATKRNDLIDLETERLRELDENHAQELHLCMDSLEQIQSSLQAEFAAEMAKISDHAGISYLTDPSSAVPSDHILHGNRITSPSRNRPASLLFSFAP